MRSETEGALAQVTPLSRRRSYARLDYTPFALVYGIGLGEVLHLWLEANWAASGWIRIQLVAVVVMHVLLKLFCYWNVHIRSLVEFTPAPDIHHAHAVIARLRGYASMSVLVPLTHRKLKQSMGGDHYEELGFEMAFQRYVYDEDNRSFEKLAYPIREPLSWYLHREGFRTEADVAMAVANWGPNLFEVSIPQFSALLQQQLLAPFFVFQVFCVGLWCLDEYWMYSVFTLFMLVFFECTVAGQRLKNMHHLRSLQSLKQSIHVYRCGRWERVPGELLLPGDIISISRPAHGHPQTSKPFCKRVSRLVVLCPTMGHLVFN